MQKILVGTDFDLALKVLASEAAETEKMRSLMYVEFGEQNCAGCLFRALPEGGIVTFGEWQQNYSGAIDVLTKTTADIIMLSPQDYANFEESFLTMGRAVESQTAQSVH